MRPGDHIVAHVIDVRENGIFLKYEGRRGIVSVVELTWDETGAARAADHARVGENIEVVVTAVGPESFGASLRECRPDENPWLLPSLVVGGRHGGAIRTVTSFGVFVNLDIGLVALCDWDSERYSAGDTTGEVCEVELTGIDRAKGQLRARRVD